MASDKKRRKQAKHGLSPQPPAPGPFRHRDGDRRRRGTVRVEEAIARKRLMRECGLIPEGDQPDA